LLGWEELDDSADNYLLTDEDGKKVQCVNNAHNRPFNETWARTLAQDILNGHWRDNGEAIVIGKSGQVLSAQHRLVGLVLADQLWRGKNAPHWKAKSSTPPVIESTLSLGVSEEPATIRTLDNVRPRTLSDVLYTEENVFGRLSAAARKEAIRNLDYAIRFLWNRTGQSNPSYGSFTSYRTHSESLDFFHRHPHLAQVVEHITGINERPKMKDEDGKTITGPAPITQVAGSAGIAAGIEYLAGCSASDEDQVAAYHQAEPPSEKKGKKDLLDWSLLEKALAFFEELPQMEEVRAALASTFLDWKGISRSRRQSRLPPSSRHGTTTARKTLHSPRRTLPRRQWWMALATASSPSPLPSDALTTATGRSRGRRSTMPRIHLVPTQRMARTCFLPMPMRSQTRRTRTRRATEWRE
jgi:hypothetical protein